MNELLIKNGRVIDPAHGIDKKCDVLIVDGNFAEIGKIFYFFALFLNIHSKFLSIK